jgi:Family of unknown function (DUF5522)
MSELVEDEDFYQEGDFIVFTRRYHLKRGYCCGSGCRHCPYDPRWTSGETNLAGEDQLAASQNEHKKQETEQAETNSTGER